MKHLATKPVALLAAMWAAGAALPAGCVKDHTTLAPPPAQPNPPPQVASDAGVRVQTLGRLADTYARLSNQLPGPNTAAHRKLMSDAFARLQEILPMLEGPTPGAEFRQQMQVIADAQAELATGPAELSPEPTIDTGLRATRDVLSSIAHAAYYERADLTPLFNQLAVKINELDTVRGPLHQVYVGDAVGITSRVITKMADVLGQRLAEQNGSAGQPTTRPTTPTRTSGG